MTDEPDDMEAPDSSVEAAAGAIEELLKQKPDAEGKPEEDGKAPAAAATRPDVDGALEQRLAEVARKESEAEAAKSQFGAALNTLVPQLQHAIRGEFGDIRTQADLVQMAASDPARYNRFVMAQAQMQEAQRARAGLAVQEQQAAHERHKAWQAGEQNKIGELVPELHDPKEGPALATKIIEFALKSGYSPQQLALASATDCAMLHRAMQYQNLDEARGLAKAKAAKAPKVAEPGTRAGAAGGDKMEADFARLKKSGRTEDAAAVIRNLL